MPDRYTRKIVNPHILANPGVVADREQPWMFDANTRPDHDSAANTRAEKPEDTASQSGRWIQRRPDDGQTTEVP
jgi:hypothetical protein